MTSKSVGQGSGGRRPPLFRLEAVGFSAAGRRILSGLELTIETGDVARVVLQALEDGRVDSAERQAIRRELGELVRAASLILEKVSQP